MHSADSGVRLQDHFEAFDMQFACFGRTVKRCTKIRQVKCFHKVAQRATEALSHGHAVPTHVNH